MEAQLRVSVYRQGRIVADRFVPPKGLVAAGVRGSALALPAGTIPRGHTLFETDAQPMLHVPRGLKGEVVLQGEAPHAVGAGDFVLGPQARGWLDLGDSKLFFQVTPPPAPVPVKALKRDLPRGWRARIEKRFTLALALVLAIEGGVLWHLHSRALPPLGDAETPDFTPSGYLPLPKLTPPPTTVKTGPKHEGRAHAEAPTTSKDARREVDGAIWRAPLLAALGALREHSRSVFSEATPAIDFGMPKAIPVSNPSPRPHRATEIGDGPFHPEMKTTHPDVRLVEHGDGPPPPLVEWDDDPIVPDAPELAPAIAKELKARTSAVQRCYERALKLNAGLRGRVVLRFVLGSDGRTDDVEVRDDSLRSPEVDACISAVARAWKLAVKPAEAVPVEFPFVLSTAG